MKPITILLSLLFLAPLLNSCSKSAIEEGPTNISLDLKSEEIVNADNQFGLEIFKEVNDELEDGKNLMISPLSISLALAMAYNGADGDTKTQMEVMLHKAGLTANQVNQTYKNLVEALGSHDPKVQLSIANAIFYNENFSVKSGFLSTNQNYYDAEVDDLDFSNSTATLNKVNGWVKDKTHDKIESIIDQVSPSDVMYLINAIYFKGEWTYQFEKSDTKNEPFFTEEGEELQVPTMTLGKTTLQYTSNEKCDIIELPYGSGKYSMLVFLPKDNIKTNDIIDQIDQSNLASWFGSFHESDLIVQLPKFEFAYENSLVDNLKALGMLDAFDASKSNFSGISDQTDLYISEVKHKSYIKVDEEGTEAAAVTGITFEITSVMPDAVFKIDHPFVFAIREKDTNALLFLGKVNNPLLDE